MDNRDLERKLVRIHEAAQFLGVTPTTWRRWEREGRLVPDARTRGGDRRYDLNRLGSAPHSSDHPDRKTVAYARVSSHDQNADLERQKQVRELYCARQGGTFEVVADLGSGMH